MKKFNFDVTTDKKCIINFGELLSQAVSKPVIFDGTGINIPTELGEGRIELYELEIGLSLMKLGGRFNNDTRVYRKPMISDDYFWMNINLSTTKLKLNVQKDSSLVSNFLINSILVTTNNNFIEWEITPEGYYKNVLIIAHRSWVNNFLSKNAVPITVQRLKAFLNYEHTQFFLSPDIGIDHIANDIMECVLPAETKQLYFHGSALNLFALLLKKIVDAEENDVTIKSDEAIRIMRLTEQVENNLDDPIPTVDEFAKKSLMGKTKFLTVFKMIYSKNFSDMFLEIKMKQAATLLQKGESVGDVGYKIGYTNLGFFAKTFKEFYNESPKQYQMKHHAQASEQED